jgi:DNA-binding transcriptional regulator LsrR (DeoR family)
LYRVVETLASQVDVAFVGIGEMGIGCPMHRDGFINEAVVNELIESGAIGETLGWAFDQTGKPVRTSIHERVTSIQLWRPPKKPVIAFAAGESKPEAVLGALRGHWINGLVTDETCAQMILQSAG